MDDFIAGVFTGIVTLLVIFLFVDLGCYNNIGREMKLTGFEGDEKGCTYIFDNNYKVRFPSCENKVGEEFIITKKD
jgi:hypothetical protein